MYKSLKFKIDFRTIVNFMFWDSIFQFSVHTKRFSLSIILYQSLPVILQRLSCHIWRNSPISASLPFGPLYASRLEGRIAPSPNVYGLRAAILLPTSSLLLFH